MKYTRQEMQPHISDITRTLRQIAAHTHSVTHTIGNEDELGDNSKLQTRPLVRECATK
jgi:UDP-2,3-diacylglucosamine pyrophosphatase LpxH